MVLGGQRHPIPSTPSCPSTRIVQTSELGPQHTHAHPSQTHDCTLTHTLTELMHTHTHT